MTRTSSISSTRRFVLGTIAATGLLTIGGCSGNGSSDTEAATGTEPEQPADPDSELTAWEELDLTGETTGVDDPNWRMLGHDVGNTFVNQHAEGPSDDPSVRWTVGDSVMGTLDGYRNHHPLIVDGTVYTSVLEERDADAEHRKLLAIDADTGETETLFTAEGRIWRPMIADSTMYVAVGRTIRAYDLSSGTEQWRSGPWVFRPSAVRSVGDVVLTTDNAVLSTSDGESVPQLRAFDADSGELLWEAASSSDVGTAPLPPIVTDETTFFPHTNVLREVESGDPRAELPVEPRYPVLTGDELYGIVGGGDDAVLVSYDWPTMERRWVYEPERRVSRGWVVALDDVVVVNGDPHCMIGLDRETGEQLWCTEQWDDHLGSMYRVACGDTVYVINDGGAVSALDPVDGSIQWQLRTDDMGWGPISGCALADDLLVTVGDDGTLFAIS